MDAIVAFLRLLYEQREKLILGILLVALAGVAFVQLRQKKNDEPNDKNPEEYINDDWKPAPPRAAGAYNILPLINQYPLESYFDFIGGKNIFGKRAKETGGATGGTKAEWAELKVKSVFDPTQSGSYIAIIELDQRSRIVKEGQQFEGYEVLRIDGVRRCLTVSRRDTKDEKEFCQE